MTTRKDQMTSNERMQAVRKIYGDKKANEQ